MICCDPDSVCVTSRHPLVGQCRAEQDERPGNCCHLSETSSYHEPSVVLTTRHSRCEHLNSKPATAHVAEHLLILMADEVHLSLCRAQVLGCLHPHQQRLQASPAPQDMTWWALGSDALVLP